jgi:hypothetical protein
MRTRAGRPAPGFKVQVVRVKPAELAEPVRLGDDEVLAPQRNQSGFAERLERAVRVNSREANSVPEFRLCDRQLIAVTIREPNRPQTQEQFAAGERCAGQRPVVRC